MKLWQVSISMTECYWKHMLQYNIVNILFLWCMMKHHFYFCFVWHFFSSYCNNLTCHNFSFTLNLVFNTLRIILLLLQRHSFFELISCIYNHFLTVPKPQINKIENNVKISWLDTTKTTSVFKSWAKADVHWTQSS